MVRKTLITALVLGFLSSTSQAGMFSEAQIQKAIQVCVLLGDLSANLPDTHKESFAINFLTQQGVQPEGEDPENLPTSSSSSQQVGFNHPDFQVHLAQEKASYDQREVLFRNRGLYNFKDKSGMSQIPLRRFDVSGIENNCLFRCFAFVNPNLKGNLYTLKTRKDHLDLIRDNLKDRFVKDSLTRAMRDDPVVRGCKTVEEYLDMYEAGEFTIPAVSNFLDFGNEKIDIEPSGFPIVLAYLSNVNLRVFSFRDNQGPQLLIHYDHPAGDDVETLNLMVYSGHYTILAFPGEEHKLKALDQHEVEYRFLTWYHRVR